MRLIQFAMISIIAVWLFIQFRADVAKRDKESNQSAILFDTSNICGHLQYVLRDVRQFDAFRIEENPDKLFGAIIHMTDNGKHKLFEDIAELGDSISKPSYSKTLWLVKKNGKTYICTFTIGDYKNN